MHTERKRPDCGSPPQPVKIVDEIGNRTHKELRYAAADAEKGWFFSADPTAGIVAAVICAGVRADSPVRSAFGSMIAHAGRPAR